MKYWMIVFLFLCGCTDNMMARNYGGVVTVDLPRRTRLVTATWKDNNLWYLVRPKAPNEPVGEYVFVEDSSFGALEGKVVFKEHD